MGGRGAASGASKSGKQKRQEIRDGVYHRLSVGEYQICCFKQRFKYRAYGNYVKRKNICYR